MYRSVYHIVTKVQCALCGLLIICSMPDCSGRWLNAQRGNRTPSGVISDATVTLL